MSIVQFPRKRRLIPLRIQRAMYGEGNLALTAIMSEAYEAGKAAHKGKALNLLKGQLAKKNPHPVGSKEHGQWDRGFRMGWYAYRPKTKRPAKKAA